MEEAIKMVKQIVSYLEGGGKDIKAVKEALGIRLIPLLEKKEAKSAIDNAEFEEYKRRLPTHDDWEGKPQPTRKPFNYGAREVRQTSNVDWE